MSAGRRVARAGRALSAAAASVAAIVVPLLYVPALASPFALPKQVAFEIAAALGFGGFLLSRAGAQGRADKEKEKDVDDEGSSTSLSRPLVWGAVVVLASVVLSAVVAARTPVGAPEAIPAFVRWAALFGLAAGVAAGVGSASARLGLLNAVTGSAAIVSLIGLWQHLDLSPLPIPVISTPGSTFGNRNLGGEAIALAIPFGLGAFACTRARGQRWLLGAALGLEVLYLAATRARGAWLGGAAGVLTILILNRHAVSRAVIVGALAIGGLALAVALLPGRVNPRDAADSKRFAGGIEVVERSFDPGATALRTRLGLWRRSWDMFGGSPVTGIGAGNWPIIFPRYAEPGAAAEGVLRPTLAPRQAHDDLLQCLTETGVVGLAALLALVAGAVVTIRRRLRGADAAARASISAAAGALVALVAAGLTGFPLEMPATLMLAGFALGLIACERSAAVASPRPRAQLPAAASATLALVLAFALGLGAVVAGERRLRASWWLAVAQQALHREPGDAGAARALAALDRAEAATPGSFRIALSAANAALRAHRPDLAVRYAEEALAREPFSPNAWAVLAVARLGTDPSAARAHAERSLALLNDHPLALFAKARAAEATGDRAAAESAWSRLAALGGSAAPERETSAWARELLRAR